MKAFTFRSGYLTRTDKPHTPATIPNLPPELLIQILCHAYSSENERSAIASCQLVSREWQRFALAVLYRDLVLVDNDQIERFLAARNDWAVRSFTRSLTLRLEDYSEPSSASQDRFDTLVCRLAKEVIPHMAVLKSFSLMIDRREFRLGILRATIAAILRTLPESCVNLELDTDGKDENSLSLFYREGRCSKGRAHLCREVERLLPRMHNVRIDLKSICEAMLGKWYPDDTFHPISLPHMQHLLIETTGTTGRPPCTYRQKAQSAWSPIIRALQKVARSHDTAPGEFTVLGMACHGVQGQRSYQTLLRCHVRGHDDEYTTLAFPATNKGPLYVRTENGAFFLDSIDSFYDIAGGRPWRLTSTGARLPVSFSPNTTWAPDEDLGIYTEAEWKERHPEKEISLWENERIVGVRLMEFEERKGDINLRKVVEKEIPEGFVRVEDKIRRGRRLISPEDMASDVSSD